VVTFNLSSARSEVKAAIVVEKFRMQGWKVRGSLYGRAIVMMEGEDLYHALPVLARMEELVEDLDEWVKMPGITPKEIRELANERWGL
jgi:hypothetical protein